MAEVKNCVVVGDAGKKISPKQLISVEFGGADVQFGEGALERFEVRIFCVSPGLLVVRSVCKLDVNRCCLAHLFLHYSLQI